MKIGEFAKTFDKKKSTIRHYTDLHLLIPNTTGTYPDYDQRCKEDMMSILHLIDLGLTLEEIRDVKLYERLLVDIDKLNVKPIQLLLDKIIGKTNDKIVELNDRLNKLNEYKTYLINKDSTHIESGSSQKLLEYLLCPTCSNTFHASNCIIKDQTILSGDFTCDCGQIYKIRKGIFMPEIIDEHELLNNTYKCLKELKDTIPIEALSSLKHIGDKVINELTISDTILFLGADTDIIISNMHSSFDKDKFYIFTAPSISCLNDLKLQLHNLKVPGHFCFVYMNGMCPLKLDSSLIIDSSSIVLGLKLQSDPYVSLKQVLKQSNKTRLISIFLSSKPSILEQLQADLNLNSYKRFLCDQGYTEVSSEVVSSFLKPPLLLASISSTDLKLHLLIYDKEA